MMDRLKLRLVDDWRQASRWASVRLAVIAGAVAGWAASDPAGFTRAVDMLPEWARPLVGLAVTVAAISSRLTTKGGNCDG